MRLVVSILGNINSALRQCFPHVKKIVRVMPNMPAQISEGISCYAPESELSPEELKVVDTILSAIGEYLKVTNPNSMQSRRFRKRPGIYI
ncbi:MAG: pyrroline-5-carboxylate reductase family protein [Bacilli bacterium]